MPLLSRHFLRRDLARRLSPAVDAGGMPSCPLSAGLFVNHLSAVAARPESLRP
jgi:hypothetical protein